MQTNIMTTPADKTIRMRYIGSDGSSHDVSACAGESLMQVATANRVKGVDGDCGGNCACGTCLIRIDDRLAARLAPAEKEERDLLSFLGRRGPTFRLGCQIRVTPEMDAITAAVVHE